MSNIHVISPGRNPGGWAVRNCIESVKRQTLQPASHVVIDDISDDDAPGVLKTFHNRKDIPYLKIVHNTERKYRLKNIYDHSITKDPEDIICIVDSDDWIAKEKALLEIKQTYESNSKLEYAYSNFRCSCEEAPGQGDGPSDTIDRNIPSSDWDPYKAGWITSHMCTFKVKALRAIPTANFLDWNGNWFRMATDHALAMPLLTTLRKRDGDYSAVKHINKVYYVYHWCSRYRGQDGGHDPLAEEAGKCAQFIRQRGYIEGVD